MTLAVTIDEQQEHKLNMLAEKSNLSRDQIIAQAISEKITDLEDYYLAVERLQSYSKSDNKSLKEVMAEYGLDN